MVSCSVLPFPDGSARTAALLAMVLVLASSADAQERASRNRRASPRTDTVLAVPLTGYFAPNMSAQAVLRLLVDSTGTPRLLRESLISESDGAPGGAAINALRKWRFLPAQRNGVRVADTIQVTIDFLAAPNKGMAILGPRIVEIRAERPGEWRVFVGSPQPRPDAAPLDASNQANVAIAALDSLFTFEVTRRVHSRPGGGTGRAVSPLTVRTACVTMTVDGKEVEPTTQQMVRLTQPYLGVVPQRRCPPTFGSMTRVVGAPDGPEGDDPWSFRVGQPRVWTTDTVLVDASWTHATAFGTNHCVVVREPDVVDSSKWRARCAQGSMGVH